MSVTELSKLSQPEIYTTSRRTLVYITYYNVLISYRQYYYSVIFYVLSVFLNKRARSDVYIYIYILTRRDIILLSLLCMICDMRAECSCGCCIQNVSMVHNGRMPRPQFPFSRQYNIHRQFVQKSKIEFQILYYLSVPAAHAYVFKCRQFFMVHLVVSKNCCVFFSLLTDAANRSKKLLNYILISDVNTIGIHLRRCREWLFMKFSPRYR